MHIYRCYRTIYSLYAFSSFSLFLSFILSLDLIWIHQGVTARLDHKCWPCTQTVLEHYDITMISWARLILTSLIFYFCAVHLMHTSHLP